MHGNGAGAMPWTFHDPQAGVHQGGNGMVIGVNTGREGNGHHPYVMTTTAIGQPIDMAGNFGTTTITAAAISALEEKKRSGVDDLGDDKSHQTSISNGTNGMGASGGGSITEGGGDGASSGCNCKKSRCLKL